MTRGKDVSPIPPHPKGECRRKNAERGMAPVQPAVFILHSTFCILHFHSWGQEPSLLGRECSLPVFFLMLVVHSQHQFLRAAPVFLQIGKQPLIRKIQRV